MMRRICQCGKVVAVVFVCLFGSICGETPKPQYTVLEQMRQSATTDKTIVVKFLQRPLAADKLDMIRPMSKGVAAHVQIVAYDKETKKIIDNFGLTGDFNTIAPAEILIEDPTFIQRAYDITPLGEVEMSSEVYREVRDLTIQQMGGAYYSALNRVDLAGNVRNSAEFGAEMGRQMWDPLRLGETIGRVGGAASGTMYSVSEYQRDGRRNYYQAENDVRQTCHPGLNCQAMVVEFLKNGEGKPTWRVIQAYHLPGEEPAEEDKGQSRQRQVDLDTIDLDDDSYDWCTCNPPEGCFETEIMVSFVCTKCMKVHREYARKALEFERRMKESGMLIQWFGEDAESKARQAADGQ
ncbi:MAG: hypothetical protein II943_06335 [Victivallales bacterium]|nr:hypothetical protein [Victivallales bacterium]